LVGFLLWGGSGSFGVVPSLTMVPAIAHRKVHEPGVRTPTRPPRTLTDWPSLCRHPKHPPPSAPRSRYAVAAFVLGLLSVPSYLFGFVSILAVILGVGLRKPPRAPPNIVLAATGIALGALTFLMGLVCRWGSNANRRFHAALSPMRDPLRLCLKGTETSDRQCNQRVRRIGPPFQGGPIHALRCLQLTAAPAGRARRRLRRGFVRMTYGEAMPARLRTKR
jgi:hypothetical protein